MLDCRPTTPTLWYVTILARRFVLVEEQIANVSTSLLACVMNAANGSIGSTELESQLVGPVLLFGAAAQREQQPAQRQLPNWQRTLDHQRLGPDLHRPYPLWHLQSVVCQQQQLPAGQTPGVLYVELVRDQAQRHAAGRGDGQHQC